MTGDQFSGIVLFHRISFLKFFLPSPSGRSFVINCVTSMTGPNQFDRRDESLGNNWYMSDKMLLKQQNKEKGSQYDTPTENSKYAVIVNTYY